MSQDTSKPQRLYKYLPAKRASEFFERPVLRFTPPTELNDIFELNAPIQELIYDRKLSAYIDHLSSRNPENSWDEISQLFLKCYKSGELSRRNGMSTLMENIGMGILSLSSIRDSLLMWAHYCENHEGFVVELDATSKFFQPEPDGRPFFPPKKIEYVIDRPRISLMEIGESEANCSLSSITKDGESERMMLFFKPVIFTKSNDWHYEKEWRVATMKIDCLEEINQKLGFAQLPLETIKSVLIGARANFDLQEQAQKFSKKHNISLKRAIPDIKRFALNIE